MMYQEKKRTRLFALPICFTTYFINEDKLTIKSGFLNTVEDDAFMYKIQDVRLTTSLLERIFRLGTITCYTGDTTHPELKIEHVKHAHEIKEYLLKASEEARIRRRTINTVDIANGIDIDHLSDIDDMDHISE